MPDLLVDGRSCLLDSTLQVLSDEKVGMQV